VGIVDYGMGNLLSVSKAFESLGYRVLVSSDRSELEGCTALVLPGVGAFMDCVGNLKELGLDRFVVDWISKKRPFLGICLGLQVLFAKSYEFGEHEGLGLIPGTVERFPEKTLEYRVGNRVVREKMKIPHMGWNRVNPPEGSPFFEGIPSGTFFYFVHSYYVKPADGSVRTGTTWYGIEFTSVVERDNLIAVQFHPEKSQKYGLRLLDNFARFASFAVRG